MATPRNSTQPSPGQPLLSYAEALRVLEARLESLQVSTETIPLEQCSGRVLAQEIAMDREEPPVCRSAMDGFALRSEDGEGPRQIVGTYFAGTAGDTPLSAGQAVAVMTGGTVPSGADAVIPVERTSVEGETLKIEAAPKAGQHVRQKGEMGHVGRVLLRPGQRLTPSDLGAIAGCGVDPVTVYRQPRVIVLATGDEVVPLQQKPESHQVRDSNRLLAATQLRSFGAEVLEHHHVADEPEALKAAVADALSQADLVITIGGVSMGEKDYLPQVFQDCCVEKLFHKIALQPGKPVWAGATERHVVLGLPGNPISSFVVLELLGRLVIDRLGGCDRHYPRPLRTARMMGSAKCRARPRLLPARLMNPGAAWPSSTDSVTHPDPADALPNLRVVVESGSGDWTSLAGAEALLYLPPFSSVEDGQAVHYLPLSQP